MYDPLQERRHLPTKIFVAIYHVLFQKLLFATTKKLLHGIALNPDAISVSNNKQCRCKKLIKLKKNVVVKNYIMLLKISIVSRYLSIIFLC